MDVSYFSRLKCITTLTVATDRESSEQRTGSDAIGRHGSRGTADALRLAGPRASSAGKLTQHPCPGRPPLLVTAFTMLRNVAKTTLRRGLHTARSNGASAAAGASRHRVALALGTSASVAGYLAYQLQSGSPKIALDAAHSEIERLIQV